jgi:adenylate cyclase
MTFYYARRYEEARGSVNKALEIDPEYVDGLNYLGAINEQQGKQAEAVAEWRKIMMLTGDAETSEAVGRAFDSSSHRGALLEWLRLLKARAQTHYVPPMTFAVIYARLGDKEQTLAWLERAHEERAMLLIWLKVEPRYDFLRSDERFQELLRKLNLSP